MIENVIILLIQLCVIAIVFYLIIYVLGVIGVPLPAKVMQLLWVVFGLIALLLILRLVLPGMGGRRWLGSAMDMLPLIA